MWADRSRWGGTRGKRTAVTRRHVLGCAALALVALMACKQLRSPQGSGCTRLWGHGDARAKVISSAWDFRNLSQSDTAKALAEYAEKPARAMFTALEKQLWPSTEPKLGYAYLLGASVVCAGARQRNLVPVGFYHPTSDVFLLTLWRDGSGGPRIIDVEVLTGDYVRRRDAQHLRASRDWTERKLYPPYAIGLATKASVLAFESMFSIGAMSRGGFRSAENGLRDDKLRQAIHLAAGKQLIDNLAELAPLFAGRADPVGAGVMEKLSHITDQIVHGQAESVAAEAANTPAPSRKALSAMKIAQWRRFKLVSFLHEGDRSLVILSHGDKPQLFMALLMSGQGASVRLRRVDLLSLTAFAKRDGAQKVTVGL